MKETGRQIFTHESLGKRQVQETLSNLLIGLILCPDTVWLVSPWISDFELLDNRSGDWDCVNPAWGGRYLMFSELLITAAESGCDLKVVSTKNEYSDAFFEKIRRSLSNESLIVPHIVKDMEEHTKGLLCSSFFLAGSMNFTYTGANLFSKQGNFVRLSVDRDEIIEAKYAFEEQYSRE